MNLLVLHKPGPYGGFLRIVVSSKFEFLLKWLVSLRFPFESQPKEGVRHLEHPTTRGEAWGPGALVELVAAASKSGSRVSGAIPAGGPREDQRRRGEAEVVLPASERELLKGSLRSLGGLGDLLLNRGMLLFEGTRLGLRVNR